MNPIESFFKGFHERGHEVHSFAVLRPCAWDGEPETEHFDTTSELISRGMSYQGIRRREGDEEGCWWDEVVAGSRHSRVRASCSLSVMLSDPWPRRWHRLAAE